jgi:hypothetical protein
VKTPAIVPDLPDPYSLRWRAGVGIPDGRSPFLYAWTEPRPGWYLNWSTGVTATVGTDPNADNALVWGIPADAEAGIEFAPMVRTPGGALDPPPEWIAATAAARPGRVWLIGNEPDVRWQDNATPEEYAAAYHRAYTAIKEADPTALVAIGGVSQITPLRLAYLDRVLAAYQAAYGAPMPVDIWTIHAFVLQEKANDWGVDIPPGMEPGVDGAPEGMLWAIEDHDDLGLVEAQVQRMRAWMDAHGERQKPLWITEYGILMPESYGFAPNIVSRFLLGSFDLFSGLRDEQLGLSADDNRLVQRWVWFSAGDILYPTGNLFTLTGEPTQLMRAFSAYLAEFGN